MYDFICPTCGDQVHFAPAYDKWAMAERALDLLGWHNERGHWLCPHCPQPPTSPQQRELP